jgi:ATP-binding cassette subfamily B protein
MKLLLKYIKPYALAALLAPLLMLLEVFMDLMQPTLMARIIDQGIIPLEMSVIMETGLIMVGITIIGLIGGIGCAVFSTFASTGLAADLRMALFEKVLSYSHKNIDAMETGSIITRLTSDVQQVEQLVRMGLRILVRAPLQIIGSLILALIISPSLSVIFLFLIPLIVFVLIILIKKSYPLFSLVQAKMDKVNNRLQESLAGVRLVKSFVRQDLEKEKFSYANDELMSVNIRAEKILVYSQPFMLLFLNTGILAVLWIGGNQVWMEYIMIGKVIAFINYMMQLLMSLIMVSHLLMNLSRAQASIGRLDQLFNENPSVLNRENPVEMGKFKGRVEFQNVSFSYNESSPDLVLKQISFSISPGEKVAFLGATGSGKSSVASLIPRLYDVTSGAVFIDGINVKEYALDSLRENIGMAPQKTILFSGSVKENIIYGERELDRIKDFRTYAEIACIDTFIDSLPDKYDTGIKQRAVNLSGGQKQRISIARALWRDPPILILDDSTSAVDTRTERHILDAIKRHTPSTVILIAQRISSAIQADRILLFDNGELIGEGTHRDLLAENEVYRDIYRTQNGFEEEQV